MDIILTWFFKAYYLKKSNFYSFFLNIYIICYFDTKQTSTFVNNIIFYNYFLKGEMSIIKLVMYVTNKRKITSETQTPEPILYCHNHFRNENP